MINYSKILFHNESRNYHHGQMDMTAKAILDNKVIGYCDYSIFENEIYIEMIEVIDEFKRQGLASRIMDFIKQENPKMKINPGMSTPDGSKFWGEYSKTNSEKIEEFESYLKKKYEVDLFLGGSNHKKVINLSRIIIDKEKRGQGIGSQLMNELIEFADKYGFIITLYPSKDFGSKNIQKLKDWYRKFGFVYNQGRNKDFSLSDPMYRIPLNESINLLELVKDSSTIEDFLFKIPWNKLVYGVDNDEEVLLNPDDIKIKWKDDLENAQYKIGNEKKFDKHFHDKLEDLPPVEVSVSDEGNFYLEDGHHRYILAKKENKPLKATIEIKGNPFKKLGIDPEEYYFKYKEKKHTKVPDKFGSERKFSDQKPDETIAQYRYKHNINEGNFKASPYKVKKIKSFKTVEGNFSMYDIGDDIRNRANMFTVHEHPDGWIVRNAFVPDDMQEQGIGTQFYLSMNKASIGATGNPLRSTQKRTLSNGEIVHELSPLGIKMWDSFVRKGYAKKLGEKDYVFVNNKTLKELNENISNGTLVNVDIQPEYKNSIYFNLHEWSDYLNSFEGQIVFLYNGADTLGMISESDYRFWLAELGVDEDVLDRAKFYDKGYAFFRYCIDEGIYEDDIVNLVKMMIEFNVNDSRDLDEDFWNEFIERYGANDVRDLMEYADDCINIPDLMDFLSNLSNIILCGGGENECLKEVEIALQALNKPYKSLEKYIYEENLNESTLNELTSFSNIENNLIDNIVGMVQIFGKNAVKRAQFKGKNGTLYYISEQINEPGFFRVYKFQENSLTPIAYLYLYKNENEKWSAPVTRFNAIEVNEKERQNGVATALYDYAEYLGYDIEPSKLTASPIKKIWAKKGYNLTENKVLSFTKKLSDSVRSMDSGFGDAVYNYITPEGVEVTLRDDNEVGELNGIEVNADIHIDFIGVDVDRGSGLASKELQKIINLADQYDLSLSVVVDPEGASTNRVGEKIGTIGLNFIQIKKWLEKYGFIFDNSYGYKPSKTEDRNQYKTKTINVNPKDIDLDNIKSHPCPEDFFKEFYGGAIKDGYHEDGSDTLWLVKNGEKFKVTNVDILYDYSKRGYIIKEEITTDESETSLHVITIPLGQELYHGTVESFDKRNLRGGGYDKIFWTTTSPSISQTYIPTSGGEYSLHSSSIAYPSSDLIIQKIQRLMGIEYDYNDVKFEYQRAVSYREAPIFRGASNKHYKLREKAHQLDREIRDLKKSYEEFNVKQDKETLKKKIIEIMELEDELKKVDDMLYNNNLEKLKNKFVNFKLKKLGYKPIDNLNDYNENLSWRIKVNDGEIKPADYRIEGRLLILKPKRDLKILDMTLGGKIEGDLTDLDYHKHHWFEMAEKKGYDGIKINDFAQSNNYGNVGHTSIGLFPRALKDVETDSIGAIHRDLDKNFNRETPEYKSYKEKKLKTTKNEIMEEIKRKIGYFEEKDKEGFKLGTDIFINPPDLSVKQKDLDEIADKVNSYQQSNLQETFFLDEEDIISEEITGGKADGMTPMEIAYSHNVEISVIQKQIQKGIKIEMEHTNNKKIAKEIAMDHLVENPNYYDYLEDMELKFDDEKENLKENLIDSEIYRIIVENENPRMSKKEILKIIFTKQK